MSSGVSADPDAPFRIAMTSYYLPSESKIGVGHQVHALAGELTRRGHEVTVFSPCAPVAGAAYRHRLVPLSGRLRTFRFATALRRIDFGEFDVLHAHGDDYWLWRRRTQAHVRTLHGSCFNEALHIRGAVERLRMVLLGFSEVLASVVADRTVVVSPGTRRWTPWVRSVVPNGVDLAAFRPDLAARAMEPVVLMVGTWGGRKRGAMLCDAFVKHVLPVVPTATLRIVTNDVPDDAHPAVIGLGRLEDIDLADEYRRAWVFCLPSSYEGFGIPYVEAMASGLPVVATPNVGARYVTADGTLGVVVPPARLGSAILGLLRDQRRRDDLAAAGLVRAQQFSLSRVAEAYERIYRETAHPSRPVSARWSRWRIAARHGRAVRAQSGHDAPPA